MANQIFSEEYDEIRAILRSNTFSNDKNAGTLLTDLQGVLGQDGPNKSKAKALDKLRDACERGFFQKLFGSAGQKESEGILALAGGGPAVNKKAAALKTLRHMRLLTSYGGHCVWVVSLPKPYSKWPIEEFDGANTETLKTKLGHIDEYHTRKEMRDMTASTQKASAWALKAGAVCSSTKGVGAEKAETLIKRWFADENNEDEANINRIKGVLGRGFGKIAAAATSGKMVLTENPVHRGTQFEQSEAYVWYDRLNVIYIEGAFFGKSNLLTGMTNWARIIVHELSHSQLQTKDIETHGVARYSWHPRGIGPMAGSFSTAQALDNADNWAWFAADANGALSQKNRNDALVRPGIT